MTHVTYHLMAGGRKAREAERSEGEADLGITVGSSLAKLSCVGQRLFFLMIFNNGQQN